MIPFMAIFFLPIAVVGGTMLYNEALDDKKKIEA